MPEPPLPAVVEPLSELLMTVTDPLSIEYSRRFPIIMRD